MQVEVQDREGNPLSPTTEAKARHLLESGRATLVCDDPLAIRLDYAVPDAPLAARERTPEKEPAPPGRGQRLLLHICCAPCATYSVARLREIEFAVTGYWYNPNIHPYSEHERRRETLAQYAERIDLPMIWEPGYDLVDFLRQIRGREGFRTRCRICYQLRLERTAAAAAERDFDAYTTTLLISPYQDQQALRSLGEEAAARHGVRFYFENLRRGWAEHLTMTRQEQLYSQRYCGCVYSEWEALDRQAPTIQQGGARGTPGGTRNKDG
jgi:predicted adenine nucleotide alpha hydrolase (AANH) superfamily ATPase